MRAPSHPIPESLHIPPDALSVFLEVFSGPLDLLLHLIRRHNLSILDIDVAEITRQYMHYIEAMQSLRLELAADYLQMAAWLAEIKSRTLLPRQQDEEAEEEEPGLQELMRKLREYECFQAAAEHLDALPRMERDHLPGRAALPPDAPLRPPPAVSLQELLLAFGRMLRENDMRQHHRIMREQLSISERMALVLQRLQSGNTLEFRDCFERAEGRPGMVVALLALMELLRRAAIQLVQARPYGEIYIKRA